MKNDNADDETPAPTSGSGEAGKRQVDPDLSREVVWYRLFKLNNLLTRPFFARVSEPYQISLTDWRVIGTLAAMGEAAAHELCDATGMHPMNVSRSVASLRRQGRVTERRDLENRRRKIITLTDEGWALYEKLAPNLKKLSRFLFDSMSPLEVEFFGKLIDHLTERLESVEPEDPMLFGEGVLEDEPQAVPRSRKRRLDE